ncbi:MAG: MBL fold metallo-hydrolase [Methanoregula sp.]|jgi:glyoxylase-like metal-dependent hydrolase (beta-lactamase superfamily II)
MHERIIVPISTGHSHAYLICGTRPIIVDTGLSGNATMILAAIRNAGYLPWDVALIIITHAHIDHYGSAATLAGATGAPVLVHTKEAGYLREGSNAPAIPVSFLGKLLGLAIGHHAPTKNLAVNPVILIDKPYDLGPFGTSGRVIPTPGHTHGSLSVILSTGECIVGDLIIGMAPATKPRLPIFAEDPAAAKESLRTILTENPEIIYTGHGGPFTREQVQNLAGEP